MPAIPAPIIRAAEPVPLPECARRSVVMVPPEENPMNRWLVSSYSVESTDAMPLMVVYRNRSAA
jgi:hypothetical protein